MRRASLNHAYRLIWSDITNTYIAVAEHTKSRGKRTALAAAVAAIFTIPGAASADQTFNSGGSPYGSTGFIDENVTVNSGVTVSDINAPGLYTDFTDGNFDYSQTLSNAGTINSIGSASHVTALQFLQGVTSTGVINNTGTISATGGTTDSTGIKINNDLAGSLTNSDTVSVSGADSGSHYGINIGGDIAVGGSLTNVQGATIEVFNYHSTGAIAYGIHTGGDLAGSLSNAGLIQVTSWASAQGEADAYGIDINGVLSGNLTNTTTGQIIASSSVGYSANANAYGIYLHSDLSSTGLLQNNGYIYAGATNLSQEYSANAYGIKIDGAISGHLNNSGNITVSATKTGSASGAFAYGIYGGALSGSLINTSTGGINVTSTVNGSAGQAFAAGISVNGITGTGSLQNAGSITVTATNNAQRSAGATGIGIHGDIDNGASLVNSGVITVSASANGSSAYASGIFIGGNMNGTLTNTSNGVISATASSFSNTAEAYGIGMGALVGTFTNAGSITATAHAFSNTDKAYGVYIDSDLSGSLNNTGSIHAIATNQNNSAKAYGINANDGISGNLTNSGLISAAASSDNGSATSSGIYASSVSGSILNNVGATISATATFATRNNGSSGHDVYGVYVSGDLANLTNHGTISATATRHGNSSGFGAALGLYIEGTTTGAVVNTGSITATATSENPTFLFAAGAYLNTLDGTFTNSGTIKGTDSWDLQNGYSVVINNGTGSFTNQAGGVLTGDLQIGGTVAVTNSGRINLYDADGGEGGYSGSGYINGNFTQTSTGILSIGAFGINSGSNPPEYGQLYVNGNANIAGTINVNVRAINSLAIGDTLFGVVQSNGLTGNFTTVTDNSALLNFVSIVDGNNIDLGIVKGATVTDQVNTAGNNAGVGAAGAIDKIIDTGATGDMQTVIDKLNTLSTAKEVSDAVNQTLPLMTAGMSQATRNNISGVNRIIQSRQEGQYGRSSGDEFYGDQKFWFKPFGKLG